MFDVNAVASIQNSGVSIRKAPSSRTIFNSVLFANLFLFSIKYAPFYRSLVALFCKMLKNRRITNMITAIALAMPILYS